MTQQADGSTDTDAARFTCVGCPLLCDDVLIVADGLERACGHGGDTIRAAIAAETGPAAPSPDAWDNGLTLDHASAMARAAATLTSARRVLVTGLAGATLEAIAAACDLAESLGAAIDSSLPESSRAAGPTIARAGEVTAAFEELRDRADLVVFWCCDPAPSHPRFIERFVAPPLADGRGRRTLAVGPDGVLPDAATHRHLPLARELGVEAARWLQMRLAGRHTTPADTPFSAACITIEEAIRSAGCVAIVTGEADDPVGLEAWSVVHLVRTVAHEKPAFQIPLGMGLAGGGADAAGAAAVCSWRYGAAGGIARADRMGSPFLPAESDARRLIERGEVDAVLALGRLSGPLEHAIACRGDALSTVRIRDAASSTQKPSGHAIELRCASGVIATGGTMLREDGRRVLLAARRPSQRPQMRDVLVDLTAAVRQSLAAPAAGGRP